MCLCVCLHECAFVYFCAFVCIYVCLSLGICTCLCEFICISVCVCMWGQGVGASALGDWVFVFVGVCLYVLVCE